MKIWCTQSIETNYKNARMPKDSKAQISIDAAKNEKVSAQILLRCDSDFRVNGMQMTCTKGDFDLSRVKICAQQYLLFNDEVAYPDPIANTIEVSVKSHATQALWISFDVPEDQAAGEYGFQVLIFTNLGEYKPYFYLKVYDVCIPSPEKGEFNMEYFLGLTDKKLFEEKGYDFEIYDEKWWAFLENYAHSLKECRVNVLFLPFIDLLCAAGSKRIGDKEWVIDFTVMDRYIALMLKHAGTKRIVSTHLASFKDNNINAINEAGRAMSIPFDEPAAKLWLDILLKQLYSHIVEKGWENMWLMHIWDEPNDADSWKWMREKVRENMPGVPCGDAFDSKIGPQLDGYMDIYVALFPAYQEYQEYFDKQKSQGKEVWSYCCCNPEDHQWLNKFIDQPHRYCRYIAWACFSQGITGFLHYGYNYWYKKYSIFGTSPDSQYKGDNSLVYPSPEDNSLRISSRYLETRDGVQDYELLKIVEKNHPEKAKELSRRIARSFNDYSTDTELFREVRKELLILAAKEV